LRIGIVSGLFACLLAGCSGPGALDVEDAWVRLPAVPGRPAAAYFTVQGGAQPRSLIRVTADYAIRAEMHESMGGDGRMSMRPIARVLIPVGEEIAFEPGGKHVMLFDLDPRAKPGATTMLTLTFDDGRRLYRKAWIVSAGADAPS
jgi:copper(I)-binding protein